MDAKLVIDHLRQEPDVSARRALILALGSFDAAQLPDTMRRRLISVLLDSYQMVVTDTECRSRRGGAFPYGAAFQRAANRNTSGACPTVRRDNVGFRVARTIRPRS